MKGDSGGGGRTGTTGTTDRDCVFTPRPDGHSWPRGLGVHAGPSHTPRAAMGATFSLGHQREALQTSLSESKSKVYVMKKDERDEAATVVGKAFAGTQKAEPEGSFNWALGPLLADRSDIRRAQVLEYVFGMVIFGTANATMLGVRNEVGDLMAFAMVWRSPGGARGTGFNVCGGVGYYRRHQEPSVFSGAEYDTIGRPFDRRMTAISNKMKQMHKQHAPGPHWYVHLVAIEPTYMGMKHCTLIMRAVSAIADHEGLPCYLECAGERSKAIFGRYGYEEVGRYTVSLDRDEGHPPRQ